MDDQRPIKTELQEALIAEGDVLSPLLEEAPNHAIAIPTENDDDSLQADPSEIERIKAEIDIADTSSIIRFGSAAQNELTVISQEMLRGVQNKDAGPAGDALREMITTIRGFSVSEGDTSRKVSWWGKLIGAASPFANFMARYEQIQNQIDAISDNLLKHEHALKKDVLYLDRLYDKTLEFYRALGKHILAGKAVIAELDATDIPALEAELAAAPEDSQLVLAQRLKDLRAGRDDLERRVHDLKLTRQVTMQALPSMRLIQENDKSLLTKIDSTLVNTVPLWETQLAQALTIQRSAEAAAAVREANDLTNDLLTANAANLRQANAAVRKEVERGIFDIEAVKTANADLIATIEESLQIADEGKSKRAEAEIELQRLEGDLRTTLARATSK